MRHILSIAALGLALVSGTAFAADPAKPAAAANAAAPAASAPAADKSPQLTRPELG